MDLLRYPGGPLQSAGKSLPHSPNLAMSPHSHHHTEGKKKPAKCSRNTAKIQALSTTPFCPRSDYNKTLQDIYVHFGACYNRQHSMQLK